MEASTTDPLTRRRRGPVFEAAFREYLAIVTRRAQRARPGRPRLVLRLPESPAEQPRRPSKAG